MLDFLLPISNAQIVLSVLIKWPFEIWTIQNPNFKKFGIQAPTVIWTFNTFLGRIAKTSQSHWGSSHRIGRIGA